jgi:predicted ribosomally synthesized peptide with SipW-like signal peptide
MNKTRAIFILGIALMLMLASMQLGGTGAHFSDTETATGNTFQAWVWQQADDLVVDKSGARLTPPGRKLYSMTIENDPENSPETSGAYDITIAEIIVSWKPKEGENIRLVRIWFEGGMEWHGKEGSGAELDIEDCTLSPGEKRYIAFTFDGDMSEKVFTIEFIMADGSTLFDPFGPVDMAEGELMPTPAPEPMPTLDEGATANATADEGSSPEPTSTPDEGATANATADEEAPPEPTPTPDEGATANATANRRLLLSQRPHLVKGRQLMPQLMRRLLLSQLLHPMKGSQLMSPLMKRPLLMKGLCLMKKLCLMKRLFLVGKPRLMERPCPMRRLVLMRVHYLLLKILAMSTFAYLYHSL